MGESVRVDVTSTTSAGYRFDNGNTTRCDDEYGELRERLNLLGASGPWILGLRLDVDHYLDAPEVLMAPPGQPGCGMNDLRDRYEDTVVPEKLWLGWTGRDLELTVGDAYVSFGRGLALSLRKVDELGVDTTVRGAKVLFHGRRLSASAVAGYVNIGNVDEASGRRADDPFDLVGGVAAQVAVTDRLKLGAHAVLVAFESPTTGLPGEASFEDTWLLAGPTVDAPRLLPNLGLYLEGLVQRRSPPMFEAETGFGAYGAVTVFAGATTFLVEAKAYGDLETVQPRWEREEFRPVQYTSPPTVERVLQPLERPQREIWGGRLRTDHALSPSFTVHASYGVFRDGDEDEGYLVAGPMGARTASGTIHDPYAGFELRWDQARSRALVSGGRRAVVADGEVVRGDGHLGFDVVQALTPAVSLEIHGIHWKRDKSDPLGSKDWSEGTFQLGVRWTPHLAVAAVLDYTSEPRQPEGNIDVTRLQEYASGTVQWDITPSSSVRLFAGASRGGLKCISGVCRVFPPFEGVRLAATLRF